LGYLSDIVRDAQGDERLLLSRPAGDETLRRDGLADEAPHKGTLPSAPVRGSAPGAPRALMGRQEGPCPHGTHAVSAKLPRSSFTFAPEVTPEERARQDAASTKGDPHFTFVPQWQQSSERARPTGDEGRGIEKNGLPQEQASARPTGAGTQRGAWSEDVDPERAFRGHGSGNEVSPGRPHSEDRPFDKQLDFAPSPRSSRDRSAEARSQTQGPPVGRCLQDRIPFVQSVVEVGGEEDGEVVAFAADKAVLSRHVERTDDTASPEEVRRRGSSSRFSEAPTLPVARTTRAEGGPRPASEPASPQVQIGTVEVVVLAADTHQSPLFRPNVRNRDLASRRYLRRT
jgi:hypothetical protein